MKRFFSMEGPAMSLITRLVDLILLNLLWIICSLPVFTFGAATTAVFTVMLRFPEKKEGHTVADFFRAFASNFKKATLIWLILLAVGAVAGVDIYLAFFSDGEALGALRYGLMPLAALLGLAWVAVVAWVFALQSRFENTVRQTLKNALLLSLYHLPSTLLFVAVMVGCVWLTRSVLELLTLWVFLGYALALFMLSPLYLHHLNRLAESAETGGEED